MEKAIIIGAGPCGLSTAIELKMRGIDPLVIDKGPLVNSIYNYPTYMIFHSTPERLEIGNIPFPTPNEKPTRIEALQYYRKVAERFEIRVHSYEKVTQVNREENSFSLETVDRFQQNHTYVCENLIIATGYFDNPNRLGVPGEDLSKVSSFYKEAHPYVGMKVAIVGGNNSAVDAAIDLERAGAEVTVIYRGKELSSHVKAWTRPIFEGLVEKGRIRMFYSSEVQEIRPTHIDIMQNRETSKAAITIENDFVLTLIGFKPDRSFLCAMGVHLHDETGAPQFDPETYETNISKLYIAGVIAAGSHANAIFIENGRDHGKGIANHITSK